MVRIKTKKSNIIITVVMDKALWQAEAFLFYPFVNTITLVISRKNLARFIQSTEHQIKIIKAPTSQ